MKKFLKIVTIGSLPFLAFVIYLLNGPYSKVFGYSYSNNVDCNTSWIYYRIFENDQPIDVAFLGTSHTGCGINDSLITRGLSTGKEKIHVANLAYCTKGRNIQYTVLKDLLSKHHPRLVVVELLAEESMGGHKDYAHVSNSGDILRSASWTNYHYPKDVLTMVENRFEYFRKTLTNTLDIQPPKNFESDYSYTPFKFFAEQQVLEKHGEKKSKRLRRDLTYFNERNIEASLEEVRRMVELADSYNVKLAFLYLPSYGTGIERPLQYEFYQELSDVWLPPDTIFKNTRNWVDGEHLNYQGSGTLGNWLIQKIEAIDDQ